MPRIFDNQTAQLATALRDTLSQALALDACVGYLNLRGWRQIADRVDALPGIEGRSPARVLVGMAARPEQMMRGAYRIRRADEDGRLTLKDAVKLRDEALREFRDQLVVGAPTDAEEKALRRSRNQLVNGQVCVKFFARYPLHAKLYLAHLGWRSGHPAPRFPGIEQPDLQWAGAPRGAQRRRHRP